MKKYCFFLLILLTLASTTVLWARNVAAAEPALAGVTAAVKGDAKVLPAAAAVPRALQSGDKIFKGDTITTEADSQLQVLLLDQTVFTLGPSSMIKVDEFIYDPANEEGQVIARMFSGIFRVVSGKVAHKKPEHMKVTLPSGTIGFRGTVVEGEIQGTRSLVILIGPQEGLEERPGKIYVSNLVNGKEAGVLIDQKGFGTVIEGPGEAPLQPFPVPAEDLARIRAALNSNGEKKSGEGIYSQTGMRDVFDMISSHDNVGHQAVRDGKMMTAPLQGGVFTQTPGGLPKTLPGPGFSAAASRGDEDHQTNDRK